MMNVNNVLLGICVFVFSCSRNAPVSQKDEVNDSSIQTSASHLNNCQNIYNLAVVADSTYFKIDNNHLEFQVQESIYVGDKSFLSSQMAEAIDYVSAQSKSSLILTHCIMGKRSDGKYQVIWEYRNPVTINGTGFSKHDFRISMDEVYGDFDGEVQSRLQIIFKEDDTGQGFRAVILSYINVANGWKLVRKERFSSNLEANNKSEVGYCRQKLNLHKETVEEKFTLSYNDVFSFDETVCY